MVSRKSQKTQIEIVIGIDPGQSGGIAILERDAPHLVWSIGVTPMPVSPNKIWELLEPYANRGLQAHLEKVASMPKQGVASMFKFGMNYGTVIGILAAAKIGVIDVPPKDWQSGLRLSTVKKLSKTQLKERWRAAAEKRFPWLSVWKETLGKQRAICDALLIADYARSMTSKEDR